MYSNSMGRICFESNNSLTIYVYFQAEYCHHLSKKTKELFSQLMNAESKPCLPNSTASEEILSAQGIEMC